MSSDLSVQSMVLHVLLLIQSQMLTLTIQSEHTPYSSVTIQHYRATNLIPMSRSHLLNYVQGNYLDTHIELHPFSGIWANLTGVQVAMNGDFFEADRPGCMEMRLEMGYGRASILV